MPNRVVSMQLTGCGALLALRKEPMWDAPCDVTRRDGRLSAANVLLNIKSCLDAEKRRKCEQNRAESGGILKVGDRTQ